MLSLEQPIGSESNELVFKKQNDVGMLKGIEAN